jgi:hypothetical protein
VSVFVYATARGSRVVLVADDLESSYAYSKIDATAEEAERRTGRGPTERVLPLLAVAS